jgi:hypothetical protein
MLIKHVKSKPLIASLWNFICVFLVVLFMPGCFVKIHTPPTSANQGPCTFTFVHVFEGCLNKINSSTEIKYKGTFNIYYVNGNDVQLLNTQDFTSSATDPSSTLVLIANIPKDNTNWKWEIAIQGTECSTCAVEDYPGDGCTQTVVTGGKTAAKPARYGKSRAVQGFPGSVTINFNELTIVQNVAGSCGCIVPN